MWNPFARKDETPTDATPDAVEQTDAAVNRERKADIAEMEYIGATAVVTFTVTELAGLDAAERLLQLLDRLGASGCTNYILDVQNVQMMDSACLGALVKTFRTIDANGGRMAIVNTDRSVAYLFKLTKLDRVFPICTDVMSALAAVERPSGMRRAG